ncbi:MAG: multiheme c-type cytochrome [Acidobacteriota bacterium]
MERFKDREHLVRMAALFAAVFFLFLVARAILVPKDFGVYGHFRAGALRDNAERPLAFAGRAACADCHDDIVQKRKGSKHHRVGCEACHGALARHAADPEKLVPQKPDGKAVCLVCHLENVAKPKGFPQVNPQEHGDGGPCSSCHNPHHPEIS